MLLLGGEILCQFIIYITKLKYIDMSILPRQAKFSSEDKGWYYFMMKCIKNGEF